MITYQYVYQNVYFLSLRPKGAQKLSNLHSSPKRWHDISNNISNTNIYTPKTVGRIYPVQILYFKNVHSNCVSSNRVQQLSQSVCIGVTLSFGWLGSNVRTACDIRTACDTRTGPKGLRGRRPHSTCVSSNRVQLLSKSVCIGVTLSFGWLGSNVRTACDIRTACDTRPGPKGLRGRRPHSNCVSSNRVQQLSQSVCVGVTLSFGWLVVRGRRPHSIRVRHSNRVRHAYRPEGP